MNKDDPNTLCEFVDIVDRRDRLGGTTEVPEEQLLTLRSIIESHWQNYSPDRRSRSTADVIADIRRLSEEYRSNKIYPGEPLSDPARIRIAVYAANRDADIVSLENGIAVFRCNKLPQLPTLPRGYAYKGGAARLGLERVLNISTGRRAPRDLDLMRFGFSSNARDQSIAAKFMPEDLKRGHSVEVQLNLPGYFNSRDLTINEAAFTGTRIFCSFAAVSDALNHILRPTPFVCDENGYPEGRITTKILRLIAEGALENRVFKTTDLAHNPRVSAFDVALHLNRVLKRGTRAAERYLAECVARGYLKCENLKPSVAEAELTLREQATSHRLPITNRRRCKRRTVIRSVNTRGGPQK